jgi:hypothetical protein
MEQEHQQVEQFDQQSISTFDQDRSTSVSSSGSSAPTDGGDGSDPHERGRHFRHLSDTSIQAKEAAHWQEMANNSPQAQQGALLKEGAAQQSSSDLPITSAQDTGIPKNMQFSIEYMAKVSLKEVRVHYDSERATEQGVAVFHEDTNVYVAPGQEQQLGEELWKVAEELKQQQGGSEPVDNTLEEAPIPSRLKAPVSGTSITHEPLGSSRTDDLGGDENVLEQQTETDQTLVGSSPNLDGLPTDVEPTGEVYQDERPKPITPKPLPTANTDQGFQAVKTAIGTEGDKQQQHKSTTEQVEDAQKAAAEPANKKSSVAQNQHLGVIEEKETPAFETSAFVEALMARVRQIMPKNKEEADNFKSSGKVRQVKSAVSGTVSSAKQQSIGPLDQVTKQEPSTAGIASKQVTPLPRAATGQNPADIQAQKAMPKPLDKDRVELPLQNNSKALEQQMLTNKMTDEQLQKSNEPTFQAALESKNTAQQDSEAKATQARQEEQQQRQQNQQEATSMGQQQMGAIHQDRVAVMTNVHGQQQTASANYTAEEKAVADKINGIFATAKVDVDKRLSRLDARVQQLFDNGAASAQRQFEAYVERRLDAYKEKRYEGISGKVSWLSDAFTGLPDEVNAFFVEGRNLYIRLMKRTIQDIARLVARELTAAKKRVQQGRQEVATYVESLPDNLRKVGKQAASEINQKFDELNSTVDAKQEELIDSLATKYAENLKAVDDRIEQLKAENEGLVDVAFEQLQGTWEAIQQVKAMITGALHAAASAIDAILQDPIGFLNNLIDGVGQGFNNFLSGIQENITTGFVTWLTGQLSSRGIQMPEDVFSLEGIFSITTQALNLTWEALRERAVGVLGEKAVGTIEEGFEIFQIIKQDGMAGAWEHIKEQFTDLKETIMDSMVGMIIREVVEAGIVSILALLTPAGAFLKAALMIVDIAKFFINQGSQLVELVNAFSASILAIANGNVGQVAKGIERALIISIPLLIGFLAALIKLGDVAAKVQKIFRKLTGRINKVIDGFIEKAGAWFKDKKGRRKAKRDKKKAEKDKKKGDEEDINWWDVEKRVTFDNGEKHRFFFKGEEKNAVLYMRSKETTVKERIAKIQDPAFRQELENKYKTQVENPVKSKGSKVIKDEQKELAFQKSIARAILEIAEAIGDEEATVPPTSVTYHMSNGIANSVNAYPLTSKAGNTKGSGPNGTALQGWSLVKQFDYQKVKDVWKPKYWERFHVLHEKMHGPGEAWNLIPAHKKDNSAYRSTIETDILAALKANEGRNILYFKANVNRYHKGIPEEYKSYLQANNTPDEIASYDELYKKFPLEITINAGYLEKDGASYKEGTVLFSNKIFPFNETLDIAKKTETVRIILTKTGKNTWSRGLGMSENLKRDLGKEQPSTVDELVNAYGLNDKDIKISTIVNYLEQIITVLNQSEDGNEIMLFDDTKNLGHKIQNEASIAQLTTKIHQLEQIEQTYSLEKMRCLYNEKFKSNFGRVSVTKKVFSEFISKKLSEQPIIKLNGIKFKLIKKSKTTILDYIKNISISTTLGSGGPYYYYIMNEINDF